MNRKSAGLSRRALPSMCNTEGPILSISKEKRNNYQNQ